MLDNAAKELSTYWDNTTFDGIAVIPIVIPSDPREKPAVYSDHLEIEEFLKAPLGELKTNDKFKEMKKEFRFIANHVDRRKNE